MPRTSTNTTSRGSSFSVRASKRLRRQFGRVCELLDTSVNGMVVRLMENTVDLHRSLLQADEDQILILEEFARRYGLADHAELVAVLTTHQAARQATPTTLTEPSE